MGAISKSWAAPCMRDGPWYGGRMSEQMGWRREWPTLAGLTVLGSLWLFLVNQLRVEWSVNEQYNYGWFVPGLSLYLFWEAWQTRPAATPPASKKGLGLVLGGLLILLLPVRLMLEANPDWRPASWVLAILVVGITWCGLYARGGVPWWRHFAFSTAFILTAVPWPSVIEQPLVRELMNWVATFSVELLTWLGIPAQARGNVIALPGQLVGVDEACSGVRSLQTILMAALFLGEVYRLSVKRRGFLLAFSLGLAFVANVARAFVLVWIVAHEGAANLSKWHDPIGYTVLIVSLAGVAALGHALRNRTAVSAPVVEPQVGTERLFTPAMGSPRVWGAIFIWLLVIEGATDAWYRWHEWHAVQAMPWSVQLPTGAEQFRPVKLSEVESRLLRVNRVEAGAWLDSGVEVMTYFLRWEPGRTAAQLARLHRPEICLPSAGCFLRSNEGTWIGEANGVTLPFRQLVFDFNRTPLYVFYCLREDRVIEGAEAGEDWSIRSRWQAMIEGRRNQGQQVLEVILRGPQDSSQAEEIMRRLLPVLVKAAPVKN
ncbi:MAG: hypothetical protein B9S32_00240 [Verrucomicrobia bacterium Tous-C9LFEB]|nr:MAG: hypothetical protein B9S32_00240 [Verrucomicrobia bacterium Tous-C9LFEB]